MGKFYCVLALLASLAVAQDMLSIDFFHGVPNGPMVDIQVEDPAGVLQNTTGVAYTGAYANVNIGVIQLGDYAVRVLIGEEVISDADFTITFSELPGRDVVHTVYIFVNTFVPVSVRVLGDQQDVVGTVGRADARVAVAPLRFVHGISDNIVPDANVRPVFNSEQLQGRNFYSELVSAFTIGDFGFVGSNFMLGGEPLIPSFNVSVLLGDMSIGTAEVASGLANTEVTTFVAVIDAADNGTVVLQLTSTQSLVPAAAPTLSSVSLIHAAPDVSEVDIVIDDATITPFVIGARFGEITDLPRSYFNEATFSIYSTGNPPTELIAPLTRAFPTETNLKSNVLIVFDGAPNFVFDEGIPLDTPVRDFNVHMRYYHAGLARVAELASFSIGRTGSPDTRPVGGGTDLAYQVSAGPNPIFTYAAIDLNSYDITASIGEDSLTESFDFMTLGGPGLSYTFYLVTNAAGELFSQLVQDSADIPGPLGDQLFLSVVHGDDVNGNVMVVLQEALDTPVVLGRDFAYGNFLQIPVFSSPDYFIQGYFGEGFANSQVLFDGDFGMEAADALVVFVVTNVASGATVVAGLADGSGGNAPPANFNLHARFIHAAPAADLSVDVRPVGTTVGIFGGTGVGTGSNFAPLPPSGPEGYMLEAFDALSEMTLLPLGPVPLPNAGSLYAAVAIGNIPENVTAVLIEENSRTDNQDPGMGTAFVKIVHAYNDLEDPVLISRNGVRVPVLMPFGNRPIEFDDTTDAFNDLPFVNFGYAEQPAAPGLVYEITSADVGPGDAALLDIEPELEADTYYTVVAITGPGSGMLVASVDNPAGLIEPDLRINDPLAHVRIGHFAYEQLDFNVTIAGARVASDLAFSASSDYTPVMAGDDLEVAITSMTIEDSATVTLEPQRVYSIYIITRTGGLSTILVEERDVSTPEPPEPYEYDYDYMPPDGASTARVSVTVLLGAVLSLLFFLN